jgi:hypothetical protein
MDAGIVWVAKMEKLNKISAVHLLLERGFRTAPSAMATYPLETYVIVGDVENLGAGVYRYEPQGHKLVKVLDGGYRTQLTKASLGQYFVEGAPSIFFSRQSIIVLPEELATRG